MRSYAGGHSVLSLVANLMGTLRHPSLRKEQPQWVLRLKDETRGRKVRPQIEAQEHPRTGNPVASASSSRTG